MSIEKSALHFKEKINKDPFSLRVNSFPEQSQEFIAFLSNMFLEKDVFEKTQKDPEKVDKIGEMLREQGLADNDISQVLKHFNLAVKEKKVFPKEPVNEPRRG